MEDQAFELDDATVTVPVPDGAEFTDLDGLPPGTRHLTWTAGPDAFFMLSAGQGYSPDGVELDSDAPAPLAGPGARRVTYRETRTRPRRVEAGAGHVPETAVDQLSDLLYVPGERANLRIGYRVPVDAPEELRALLARMLDGVKVDRDA